jgi:hypothetical protein
MMISELFVRVSGDTSDVTRKLAGVQTSLVSVGRGADGSKFAFNGMTSALSSLASQVTGVNPAISRLSTIVGSFALGGPVVAAALAGLAAVAAAYEWMGRKAKEAEEAQRKLTDALISQFKPRTGPDSETAKAFNAALQERADLTKKIAQLEQQGAGTLRGDALGIMQRQVEAAQTRIAEISKAINNAMTGSISTLETVTVKATSAVEGLKFGYMELQREIERTRREVEESGKAFWRSLIEQGRPDELTSKMVAGFLTPVTAAQGVDISDSVKIAGDHAKKINDAASRNTQLLQHTIDTLGRVLVSALNIGGGGKGSQIGGALGSGIGFGIGSFLGVGAGAKVGGLLGSALPGVGTVIGGLLGSAIGGLFGGHKKEVSANTQALRANTQALLLNAPSGFKVERYRYDATDVKELHRAARALATRGGAAMLGVT